MVQAWNEALQQTPDEQAATGENMVGEWIDKEPRADGKPRRWKPSEIITVDLSRVIFQEERTEQHPLDNTQLYVHTNK